MNKLIERARLMIAWNIFLNGKEIDTMYFEDCFDAQSIKNILIEKDGYHSDIEVKKQGK